MRRVLLIVALLAASSAGAQAKSGGSYSSAQASRGATVYRQDCAQCHGASLRGESEGMIA
jgi:alcohol dehydrogenase (cytochrome c)